MKRPQFEVADIFRRHGPTWRANRVLPLAQLKAMSAIERCRSAALGGHVLHCEHCAVDQIAYNSCRNRHCPKCQSRAAKQWLVDRQADLLPVEYYHLVFTLPAIIAQIAYQNPTRLYNLLFKITAQTLYTIAADPKHLGAKIGTTAVLHTWGSALTHHPHIHCIVPGGGLNPNNQWIACKSGFFLPVKVLSRLFKTPVFRTPCTSSSTSSILRFTSASNESSRLQRVPESGSKDPMGRLCQTTLRRTQIRARLSIKIYPPGRYLKQPNHPH